MLPDELKRFVHSHRLDPYFKDFHDFARQRGIEVVVLSDGLDYYIEQILMRNRLEQDQFFANSSAWTARCGSVPW
jgi:2-hydroxy-3-keto-5-methylthiopentenyl-1-phosphate phosphatase